MPCEKKRNQGFDSVKCRAEENRRYEKGNQGSRSRDLGIFYQIVTEGRIKGANIVPRGSM